MKVCIVRNAEARTNAAIARVVDALSQEAEDIFLLTRNRYVNKSGQIKEITYESNGLKYSNYEIGLKNETGNKYLMVFQLLFYQLKVFAWLFKNKNKYDVVHAFDLDAGVSTYLISKILKKRYIYHIADFYADSRAGVSGKIKKILKKLEFSVINSAEATIICTEQRFQQIKGSKPKKVIVVHNTPIIPNEIQKFLSETIESREKTNENLIFTYVGGLSEKRFIKSAVEVIKKYPQIKLNIAGMGKLEDYLISTAHEYENINFYGRIDYHDALQLYSVTDYMFAMYDPQVPNHKYSAPNKVYEAMMLGKPIIVAEGTGIDGIVKENEIGFVIDYSIQSFENLIKDILDNPQETTEYSSNSKKSYSKYSWESMREKIIEIYKSID